MDRSRRGITPALLWALLFALLWPIFWEPPDTAIALNPVYKASLERELKLIISKKPRYVWGGLSDEKGVDCSGFIWLAAKRAALPVQRTTAERMRHGFGGWAGRDIGVCEADSLDLIWWTWRDSKRPFGHVGAVLFWAPVGLNAVCHASGSRKCVVVEQLQGQMVRDLAAVRRLTIGD